MLRTPSFEDDSKRIVASARAKGINFIAIDFDCTLVNCHTGGRWIGTLDDLASQVHPLFRQLVPMAIENGIWIAIVTFSPQVSLIKEVLRSEFPAYADHIPVRGEDGGWEYEGKGKKEGKQWHMASAAEELVTVNDHDITRKSTLLIDDDSNNVGIALNNHVLAVLYDNQNIESTIESLVALEDRRV